jgi:hypothetical protein
MHLRRARAGDNTGLFSFRYNVVWLKRIRFSEILLGDLPLGAVAPLTHAEREVCPVSYPYPLFSDKLSIWNAR